MAAGSPPHPRRGKRERGMVELQSNLSSNVRLSQWKDTVAGQERPPLTQVRATEGQDDSGGSEPRAGHNRGGKGKGEEDCKNRP